MVSFIKKYQTIFGLVLTIITAVAAGVSTYYISESKKHEQYLNLRYEVDSLKAESVDAKNNLKILKAEINATKDTLSDKIDRKIDALEIRLRSIEQSTARIEALLTQRNP